jgi:hypothetical protein
MSNALNQTEVLYFVVAFTYISLSLHTMDDGWGMHAWVVRVRCSHYGFPNYLFHLTTTTSTFLRPRRRTYLLGMGSPKRFRVSPKGQKKKERISNLCNSPTNQGYLNKHCFPSTTSTSILSIR